MIDERYSVSLLELSDENFSNILISIRPEGPKYAHVTKLIHTIFPMENTCSKMSTVIGCSITSPFCTSCVLFNTSGSITFAIRCPEEKEHSQATFKLFSQSEYEIHNG